MNTDYTIRSWEPTGDGRMRVTYVPAHTLTVRHLTLTRAQLAHGHADVLIRHAIAHVGPKRKPTP